MIIIAIRTKNRMILVVHKLPQNSRCHLILKALARQREASSTFNIRCLRMKFSRPGNLAPVFLTPSTIPFDKDGHEALFLCEEDRTASFLNTVHTNSTDFLQQLDF